MSRTTIGDVASRAGVSVATVSRALRGLENVNPETRRRVEEAAESLHYVVDRRASSLASGRTNTIGVVAPLFHTWYASQTTAGLEGAMGAAGYDLLIYSLDPQTPALPALHERFYGRSVDGIVFIDVFFDADDEPALVEFEVPMVTIGDTTSMASSITIDDRQGVALAVEHLAELGHRRFGYVGGRQEHETESLFSMEREAGVRAALDSNGLDEDELEVFGGGFTTAGGREVMRELAERADAMPTAIVCASDEMAMGMIAEAQQLGIGIPDDVSIVGFDGHDMGELFNLTTVAQPVGEKGSLAGELVLAALDDPAVEPTHVELPVELLIRGSTSASASGDRPG